jgi:hypothetical protein
VFALGTASDQRREDIRTRRTPTLPLPKKSPFVDHQHVKHNVQHMRLEEFRRRLNLGYKDLDQVERHLKESDIER